MKIIAVAAVIFLALGAAVLVYAGSQNDFKAIDDEQQMSTQTFFNSNTTLLRRNITHRAKCLSTVLSGLRDYCRITLRLQLFRER